MAMASNKNQCASCSKNKATSICAGCLQNFCSKYFTEHRQQLSSQLDQVKQDKDLFQQTLSQHQTNSQKNLLMEQVNRWEEESIVKIRQTAEEMRQFLSNHINENICFSKKKLDELTQQLRGSREEDEIIEEDLHKWSEELKQLTTSSNISVRQTETPLIKKLEVQVSAMMAIPDRSSKVKWMRNGITVGGGNGQGNRINQLNGPYSACVDDDQNIYVADCANHRIVQWQKDATIARVVAGGQGHGNRNDQLNYPTNVIMYKKYDCFIICDYGNKRVVGWSRQNGTSGAILFSNIDCWGVATDNDGYLYISDRQKHEVRRWKIGENDGTLVAGGNGKGNRFDQLNEPYHVFVDEAQSVYVSDGGNNGVMKWVKGAREGIVVAGGQGGGNALNQLSGPRGIVVDQLGTVYVADCHNHRVVRWLKGAREGSIVVGGKGGFFRANQLNYPWDLSFDRQNNLYVADYGNHRIQKFNIE